jgi:hypothetical protein
MFERLKYLYEKGLIQEVNLNLAVSKGWITEEEKTEITK